MAQPGSTRVWNSPSTSPPRTLTAPISVIALSFGDPPVVSRSTTTKVTSASGVPSSSIVACSKRGSPAAARAAVPARRAGESGTGRAGEGRTGRTVGRGADSPGDARRGTGPPGPSGGSGAPSPGAPARPPEPSRRGPLRSRSPRWSVHVLSRWRPGRRAVASLSVGVVALAAVLPLATPAAAAPARLGGLPGRGRGHAALGVAVRWWSRGRGRRGGPARRGRAARGRGGRRRGASTAGGRGAAGGGGGGAGGRPGAGR